MSRKSSKNDQQVTVKVDSENESSEQTKTEPAPQTKEVVLNNVVLRDTDAGPKLEMDPSSLFDLSDVRL